MSADFPLHFVPLAFRDFLDNYPMTTPIGHSVHLLHAQLKDVVKHFLLTQPRNRQS